MHTEAPLPQSTPRLDALFGATGPRPKPNTTAIALLYVSGLLLAVVGLLFSSVPGAILVLLAGYLREREQSRLDSGFLPADCAPVLAAWRRAIGVGLICLFLLFTVQIALLSTGFYTRLWGSLISLLFQALSTATVNPPAPL